MAKWLYIPVEVKVRELQSKLLLAKHAAAIGYSVIIGRKSELLDALPHLPKGIFFGLWVPRNFKALYKNLKDRNFATTGLDEEGLVTFSEEIYANFRLSSETLLYVDQFFAWGKYQADIVEKYCDKEKIKITGNLRFDLLRPELRHILSKDSAALKKKYGRIVLIVSSFAFSNHFSGAEAYIKAQKKSKIINTPEDEAFFRRYMHLQDKNFQGFLEAVPRLAKEFPDHTFVIRPHPAENTKAWEKCKNDFKNVIIESSDNIQTWMFASECILHHFCTTALEAFAANVPAISLRTFKDSEVESELPYIGSLESNDIDNLCFKMKEILSGAHDELTLIRKNAIIPLKNYICNLDNKFCYEYILDHLSKFKIKNVRFEKLIFFLFAQRQKIISFLKYIKRNVLKQKASAYIDHKFSTLTKSEIEEFFEQIPMTEKIHVKLISSMCFMVVKE